MNNLYIRNIIGKKLIKFVDQNNPYKDWNWMKLSSNPNITWEIIKNNPTKQWNWNAISLNPNITW